MLLRFLEFLQLSLEEKLVIECMGDDVREPRSQVGGSNKVHNILDDKLNEPYEIN